MSEMTRYTKYSPVGSAIIKGTIEMGRFSIPYRIYESEGPHIICVNGVQQSMAMWHSLVERYSPGYRVVLFDFPNQGRGEVVSGPASVSLDEQVEILREVIKATGTNNQASLCAASWGGVIALAFAARFHGQVKQLCLASLGTKANDIMIETIKKGIAADPADRQKMADILIEAFGQNLPENIKNKIISQFSSMSQKNLDAFYEHGQAVISKEKLGDLVRFSDIREKTFLIYGEKDTIIDLEDVKFLSAQIPNCEVRVVKGAGHFLHMEQIDIFDIYADILPFIPA